MGLLTPQGPPQWHPAPPELREAAQAAADYCKNQGLDLAKLALQFAVRYAHAAGIEESLVVGDMEFARSCLA